ncbi:MAG: hypothetical protein JW807_09900 [Spirochaetes bacterium]|nr:hypothetical protein [Spirochaetota bacterium]
MEIRDIIKSDSDRLFIVDPECYIIFTGETTDDIKPFIRIGNWNDMPVELIPLIENIIITDNLIGNPAHEQFNIDVRNLQENRYIGSRGVVRIFLDFQKIFGLDLTNASIVDIEKDLPDLSKAKNISRKDQFIGVFYRNGNFKVLLDNNTIFDLNKITQLPISWQKFHDHLAETHRNAERYAGAGLVVVGHNPMFYNRKSFYTYLFPMNYLKDFSLLGIDPGKIQAIMHPSLNLINLSKLFGWLNNTGRKITVFANSIDIDLFKKLYSRCWLQREDFSGFEQRTGDGLVVKNYPGTYNLKLEFHGTPPHGDRLAIGFIKGSAGTRGLLKEKLDALVINYTAYEDIHLLLKSTAAPYAIIDDGNKNVAKLAGSSRIVLSAGVHYSFCRYLSPIEIFPLAGLDDVTIARIATDTESLTAELAADRGDAAGPDRQKILFNMLSLARVHLHSTRDRGLASRLRGLVELLSRKAFRSGDAYDPARHVIMLALYDGSLFPFITECETSGGMRLFDEINPADAGTPEGPHPAMREYWQRIIDDRARLGHLIEIYTQSKAYTEKNMPELSRLKEAIRTRKEQYQEESLSLESSWSRSIATSPAEAVRAPASAGGIDKESEIPASIAARLRSLPAAVKITVPLALLLLAAALLLVRDGRIVERIMQRDRGPITQSRELDEKYSAIGKQMNIRIRDHDILEYANKVAVKNGYYKIAETTLKERNPDWIYPHNIFVMLDGQRVVVSRGDTLWNLSKNKLIESSLAFDDLMKRIYDADIQERLPLVNEARRHAFSEEQLQLLRKAVESLPRTDGGAR